jgi:hypothetical protein
MDAVAKANAQHEKLRYYRFSAGVLVCDREYSEAEYSQLADYQGRTPVNLMTIGEKKWWSDGVQSLVLDIEHIAERGTEYQVFCTIQSRANYLEFWAGEKSMMLRLSGNSRS